MKIRILVAVLALTSIWVSASGQCKKPEVNAIWDTSKSQFRCVDPAASTGSDNDESVSPTGSKESCAMVRENLLKVCPLSDEGKICKSSAKSIFNACYKSSNRNEDHNGSPKTTSQMWKTDSSTCMTAFNQQQQACQSRRQQPPSRGQPYTPDTCLQDALAAQNKCLANSR
jgi:hypothetical protein